MLPTKDFHSFDLLLTGRCFCYELRTDGKLPNSDIMGCMARGWESKSVEAQQAEASENSAKPGPAMTAEEAAHWRKRESLRLSRQVVLQQLEASTNPRHRKLLQDALADLDEKLRE